MAEVQTSTQSGELTQRFIEFVMMQAQQASLFLGRIPHPQSGQSAVQLEPAKLFIDHLEMIREKTRGNLTNQEAEILNGVLADLQMAFVQASAAPQPSASTGSLPPQPTRTARQRRRFMDPQSLNELRSRAAIWISARRFAAAAQGSQNGPRAPAGHHLQPRS
jgi:hypothetical protein